MEGRTLDNSAQMNKVKRMSKSRKVIKSEGDVIAAYGGTAKCADRWDRSPGAVSMWRKDGIPNGYHYRMARELEDRGYIVDGRSLGWI